MSALHFTNHPADFNFWLHSGIVQTLSILTENGKFGQNQTF